MKDVRFIKPEETYRIRKEILRKNIDLPSQFDGDFDESTFHLGVFEDGKLAGISTFVKKKSDKFEGSQFQLRGMAILEQYRGKGYGKVLIKQAEQILEERDVQIIWCNARVLAAEFYKSMGYDILGGVFEVPEIGNHYVMFKKLHKKILKRFNSF